MWLGAELGCGQGEKLDFSLSAEQEELKAAAVDFARRELDQDLAKREEAGEFPRRHGGPVPSSVSRACRSRPSLAAAPAS